MHYPKIETIVLISIVTWNRLDILKNCLEGVFGTRYDGDLKIWISDNGSKDGTVEYLKGLDDDRVRLFLLSENLGVVPARNLHIKERPKDAHIMKLDDDVRVYSKGWLSRMLEVAEEYEPSILGLPYSSPQGRHWKTPLPESLLDERGLYHDHRDELYDPSHYGPSPTGAGGNPPIFGAQFIPSWIVDELGGYVSYGKWGLDDIDYAYRALQFGPQLRVGSIVWEDLAPYHAAHSKPDFDLWEQNLRRYQRGEGLHVACL